MYFFLSYARGGPTDDDHMDTFFNDLSTEVRTLTGDDHHEVVGFHDSNNLRAGDAWPQELVEALATAWTFVPLCSPRYFRSSYCGKEWAVFAQRVAAYEAGHGRRAPSIIPVFWVRTRMPDGLGNIQHRDPSFGEAYEGDGLRELLRLDRRHDYATFVRALALRIHRVASEFPLPPLPGRPDFHRVQSAFHGPAVPASQQEAIPAPRPESGAAAPTWDGPAPWRPVLKLDPGDSTDQRQ